MSAVSRHLDKFTKPRIETLKAIAKREEMNAALQQDVARMARQKRIDAVKRKLFWWVI